MATNNPVSLEVTTTLGCDCGCRQPAPRMRISGHLPLLPAFVLVLLPKCPLCLMAWCGILGSVEIDDWVSDIWGTPLAVGLLSVAMIALMLRARRNRKWGPFILGLCGSAVLLAGKCLIDTAPLIYTGLVMLIGASIWSSRRTFTPTISSD